MKLLLQLSLAILFVACSSSNQEKIIDRIKHLENNKSLANSDTLINSYIQFADAFPEHEYAPVFLFKAAQANISSNRIMKGVKLYERVAVDYQNHPQAPNALINAGVSFQSLNDAANAKRMFEKFMKNYPKHERFNDVKLMSETVGLSEAELMERFYKTLEGLNDSTNIELK